MSGAPWVWPPAAGVAQSALTWLAPNVASILIEVASGANATLVPAPPAGYAHVVSAIRIKNVSAVNAAAYVMTDGAGNSVAANTGVAASAYANSIVSAELWATTAISVAVSGLGGPLQFSGTYTRVPLVSGSARLVPFIAQIALAPVAVPQCVPPAGFGSTLLGIATTPAGGGAGDAWILNRDTAPTSVLWRVTRSAVLWDGLTIAAVAANARSSQFFIPPTLLAGDTFEIRTLVAPAVGTVWIGGVFIIYPLAV